MLPPTDLHALDRGEAWGRFLHLLSEYLLLAPRWRTTASRLPFSVTYQDLAGFSVRERHVEGIDQAARGLQVEADLYDEYLEPHVAHEQVLSTGGYPPSAYDLIVMCNFLTEVEMTESFETEIRGLSRSLTPGGVLLTLGSATPNYEPIFQRLQELVGPPGLRRISLGAEIFQAQEERWQRDVIWAQIRNGLLRVRSLAPDAFERIKRDLPSDVRELDAPAPHFPMFRVLAFKSEGRRTGRRRR